MPDGTNFGGALPRATTDRDAEAPAPAAPAPATAPEAPAWRPERISGWLAGH